MSSFRYCVAGEEGSWTNRFDRVIEVPAGLSTKELLLDALGRDLEFPEWFGTNWDALLDCLSDLSWLSGARVLLRHQDLPLNEDPDQARVYLEVLTEALERWQGTDEGGLAVAFPESVRSTVEAVVGEGDGNGFD